MKRQNQTCRPANCARHTSRSPSRTHIRPRSTTNRPALRRLRCTDGSQRMCRRSSGTRTDHGRRGIPWNSPADERGWLHARRALGAPRPPMAWSRWCNGKCEHRRAQQQSDSNMHATKRHHRTTSSRKNVCTIAAVLRGTRMEDAMRRQIASTQPLRPSTVANRVFHAFPLAPGFHMRGSRTSFGNAMCQDIPNALSVACTHSCCIQLDGLPCLQFHCSHSFKTHRSEIHLYRPSRCGSILGQYRPRSCPNLKLTPTLTPFRVSHCRICGKGHATAIAQKIDGSRSPSIMHVNPQSHHGHLAPA